MMLMRCPPVFLRRTVIEDIEVIRRRIVGDDGYVLAKLYGQLFNLAYIVQTGFLSITALDEEGTIIAFASFNDVPTMPACLSKRTTEWEDVIKKAVSPTCAAKRNFLPSETLFLTFFATIFGNGRYETVSREADGTISYCEDEIDVASGLPAVPPGTHRLNQSIVESSRLEESILRQMLSRVFSTCPHIQRVAFVRDKDAPSFAPIETVFFSVPLSSVETDRVELGGALLTVQREDVHRPLILRRGVPEDYDDLVPLLLNSGGNVTPLPEKMYLDEMLADEGLYNATLVAEDPATHKIVGFMALDSTYEDQLALVKQYQLEQYHKLRPLASPQAEQMRLKWLCSEEDAVADSDLVYSESRSTEDSDTGGEDKDGKEARNEQAGETGILEEKGVGRGEAGGGGGATLGRHKPQVPSFVPKKGGKTCIATEGQHRVHNSFQIVFFYINPEFDSLATQFIPYAFSIFPFAEYCYVLLPHEQAEHPILFNFSSFPIKRYIPTDSQGARVAPPLACFVCCRYGLEPVLAVRYTVEMRIAVDKMLRSQASFDEAVTGAVSEALERVSSTFTPPPVAGAHPFSACGPGARRAIVLHWRHQPVGVAVYSTLSTSDAFALRRNFDIEEINSFCPRANYKYDAVDFTQSTNGAKLLSYKNDLPCVLVEIAYVKTAFRNQLRFLLREVLRLSQTQLLLHAAEPGKPCFPPLLDDLIFVKPRSTDSPAFVFSDTSSAPAHPEKGVGNGERSIDAKFHASSAGAASRDARGGSKEGDEGAHDSVMDQLCGNRVSTDQNVYGDLCLFQSTRRNLSDEKVNINARVIIVGASTTALSIIYALLTAPGLLFKRITLLSTEGLPSLAPGPPHLGMAPLPLSSSLAWETCQFDFIEREYALFRLDGRITVVEDSLSDFDNVARFVVTAGGTCLPYDELVLAVGRQYTLPRNLPALATSSLQVGIVTTSGTAGSEMTALLRRLVLKNSARSGVSSEALFVDEDGMEESVEEDCTPNVVAVYGRNLDAYCAVTSLLRLGVEPSSVLFIQPPPEEEEEAVGSGGTASGGQGGESDLGGEAFEDPVIATRVERELETAGVAVLKSTTVVDVKLNDKRQLCGVVLHTPDAGNYAEGCSFEEENEEKIETHTVEVRMLVCVHDKDISRAILSALNRHSIVFDGRVIVENNYRTTDPKIFAAGPVAMFSLRLGPSKDFELFNRREHGAHVARMVMGAMGIEEYIEPELLVVPSRDRKANQGGAGAGSAIVERAMKVSESPEASPAEKSAQSPSGRHSSIPGLSTETGTGPSAAPRPLPLPVYSSPICRATELPGGSIFFVARACDSQITTFSPKAPRSRALTYDSDFRYTRVDITPSGRIERVLYHGAPDEDLNILRALVGTQESMYNLEYVHRESACAGRPLDICKYLREPKMFTIFYDRFLRERFPEIMNKLRECEESDVAAVREEAQGMMLTSSFNTMDSETRFRLMNALRDSKKKTTTKIVELELIKFMHEQKAFFPLLYYLPDVSAHVHQHS